MLHDGEHYRIGLDHRIVKYYHPKKGIKSTFLLVHLFLLVVYVAAFLFFIIAIFLTKDLWRQIVGLG